MDRGFSTFSREMGISCCELFRICSSRLPTHLDEVFMRYAEVSEAFLDVKCQGQPSNELLKFGDPLHRGIRLFISGFKEGRRIFKKLSLPLSKLFIAEVMSPTHFCLGTFTAESLKNNFGFKLGSEVSSFSFRHRILLSSRWILYHILVLNLVLESDPNFRWQYRSLSVSELKVQAFRLFL